jgi:4-amino-4-deoxy-L-arabinose transferase-like glycosyltransferase
VKLPAVDADRSKKYVANIAVFLLACAAVFCFRAVLPASMASNESGDYTSFYQPVARNLIEGRGFLLADGRIALRYPPGYPVILAGTFLIKNWLGFSESQAIGGLSALSVAVAALCIFGLAKRVWPGQRALVAPALVFTYPLLLWFCKQPSSELPFLALLSAAVLTFWAAFEPERRERFAFLAGVLLGCAMLIRPIALAMGILFAVFAWKWDRGLIRRRAWLAGLVLFGNALAILPWELWVLTETGKVIPLSSGGPATIRFGLVFFGSQKPWQDPIGVSADVAELTADIEARYGELKSLRDVVALMRREAGERPMAVAKLLGWKAIRPWYATDKRRYEHAVALLQIPYLAVLIWSARMAKRQGGRPARVTALLVACCVLFWVMAFTTVPIVRYLVPGITLLFAIVPAGVSDRWSQRAEVVQS